MVIDRQCKRPKRPSVAPHCPSVDADAAKLLNAFLIMGVS